MAAMIMIITNPEGVFLLPRVSSSHPPSAFPRAQSNVASENLGHQESTSRKSLCFMFRSPYGLNFLKQANKSGERPPSMCKLQGEEGAGGRIFPGGHALFTTCWVWSKQGLQGDCRSASSHQTHRWNKFEGLTGAKSAGWKPENQDWHSLLFRALRKAVLEWKASPHRQARSH